MVEKTGEMLTYSAVSYLETQPLYGFEVMHTIDDKKSGVQCYIRIKEKRAVITFRGTDSPVDRYKDVMFCKKCSAFDNGTDICVHRGFLSSYTSKNVKDRIHEIIGEGAEHISITGHSLGAAMAVLCAYDLQKSFPFSDYEVFLYGCPRVGNAAFMRSYNKRLINTLRVENGNDIVCRLPPAFFGYRHVGSAFHIGAAKLPLAFSFSAHHPDKYFENLMSALFLHKC